MSEQVSTAENGLRPDVTPEAVVALRLAADAMPISRPGQQWSGAADWLRRRADAFEVALRDAPIPPAVCPDCGHVHTPEGCTGDPTPSDLWAGVSVEGCDCAWDQATRVIPPG